MSRLRLFFLGKPQIRLDGEAVEISRRHAVALLAYLAVTDQVHSRESLAAMLWPEADTGRAFAYLRRALYALNQALGDEWLAADRDTIRLQGEAEVWSDVAEFRARAVDCSPEPAETCADCLAKAADLYRGDFLAGFGLENSPAFDDWQRFESENLRSLLTNVLERLAACQAALGWEQALIDTTRRWVELDRLDERAQRALMRAYAAAGQRTAAIRQYEALKTVLQDELRAAPDPETRALYERIRTSGAPVPAIAVPGQTSRDAAGAVLPPAEPDRSTPAAAPPDNLPDFLGAFVGRQTELAQIEELLRDPGCRLLTLTGPGGIGKTRLGLETARRVLESRPADFPHGVFFAPLAPLTSVDSLPSAIAEALRFSFRGMARKGETLESQRDQLIDYLRARRIFLLVDNFEHVVAGAALLEEIAAQAPGVQILVTSRERLNLPLEYVLEIGGMAFPADGSEQAHETFSAVQLFLQHARRARVSFSPQEADWAAIVRTCRLVQGMPLAIELAASWVRTLSCREIADEIERNLDFLSGPKRKISPRHQSLRAAFEHSWRLLSPEEQAVFRRLSVFRTAFTRQAAEEVTAAGLADLAALVDKSLLRHEPTGRYAIHELLKQYAAERLDLNPEEAAQVRAKHATFYAGQLKRLVPFLQGRNQLEALRMIDADLEDKRRALHWAVGHNRLDLIEQMATGLWLYYAMRYRSWEGKEDFRYAVDHLSALRDSTTELPPNFSWAYCALTFGLNSFLYEQTAFLEADAVYREGWEVLTRTEFDDPRQWANLMWLAVFGRNLVSAEQAHGYYLKTISILEEAGEWWQVARAHMALAMFAEGRVVPGNLDAAQLYRRAIGMFKSLGDRWSMARCLNSLAFSLIGAGEYVTARPLAEEVLDLYSELGDPWLYLYSLLNLGQIAASLGEYAEAQTHYTAGLQVAREMGNRAQIAVFLDSLGYLDRLAGDAVSAGRRFEESLALARTIDDWHGTAMALANLGDVARERGDFSKAGEYYREGLSWMERTDEPWGLTLLRKKSGINHFESGDLEQARNDFRKALEIATRHGRNPETLELIIQAARILVSEGESSAALTLLASTIENPATSRPAREAAQELISELRKQLDPDEVEAAVQRGQAIDTEQVLDCVWKVFGAVSGK